MSGGFSNRSLARPRVATHRYASTIAPSPQSRPARGWRLAAADSSSGRGDCRLYGAFGKVVKPGADRRQVSATAWQPIRTASILSKERFESSRERCDVNGGKSPHRLVFG